MREWLKEKRHAAGLTMKQISEKLDLTEGYYCRIECGNRKKKLDIVLANKMADLFSITVDEIIRLESEGGGQ